MKRLKFTPIKKLAEIVSRILLVFLLILVFVWTLLQIGSVQTFLAHKTAEFLTEELQAEISINKIKLRLLKKVQLDDLLIKDQYGDTLASIDEIDLDLHSLSLSNRNVSFSANLESPFVQMRKREQDSSFNYQFIIDYFKGEEDSTEQQGFQLLSPSLSISNGRFILDNDHQEAIGDRMDYAHMDISNIDLLAREIAVDGIYIDAWIEDLSLRSSDDFELERFSTQLKIEPELLSVQELKIQTFGTELSGDLAFTANSFKNYRNFIQEVYISANFNNALVELSDIAYFVPQMNRNSHQVLLNGEVKGTVDNLSSKQLEININKDAYLLGEFDVRGLPNINETFIFFDAEEIFFNSYGLRELPISSFSKKDQIRIPEQIDRMGGIRFKGNYTGYINDFVAYGVFTTDVGSLKTDILLSQEEGGLSYEGVVSSNQLDLATILSNNSLDHIGFNLELDGKGVELDEVVANAKGEVSYFDFRGYRYDNIDLNGNFSSKRFNGKLSIADRNLKLDFEGRINADTAVLASYFNLDVEEANLAKLKLFNQGDSLTKLSFKADFDLTGSRIDNFDGTFSFDSLHYVDSNYNYRTTGVSLNAKGLEVGRQMDFASSFMDISLIGEFKVIQLPELLAYEFRKQIPNEVVEEREFAKQDFEYEVLVKEFGPISQIFLPELQIDSGTTITGSFDNEIKTNTLNLKSSKIAYGSYKLRNLVLSAGGNPEGISLSMNARSFSPARAFGLSDFHLSTSLEKGEAKLNISWEGVNDSYEHGQLQLEASVDSIDIYRIRFLDSYFYLNDSLWKITGNNYAEINGKEIFIDSIQLASSTQGALLNGRLSENKNDSMYMFLNDFDLQYLSSFLNIEDLNLYGSVSGDAVIRDPFDQRLIVSDLKADSLIFNDYPIGEAVFESHWLKDSAGIVVNSYIGQKEDPLIMVKGVLNPKKKNDQLDMDFKMNKVPVSLAEPFIDDILTELEGNLSGKVKISGASKTPQLNGELNLIDASCKVNYLNTSYKIDHTIMIRPDFIGFDLIQIEDENGSFATATGTVFHENYSDFNLDIGMEMENFLGLNTEKKDNELFYGKGIVSGWANISGYADQLILELNLKAKEGTDMKIPIESGVSVSSNEFLVFTNSPEFNEDSNITIDLSGIELNFELEVEPEAKTTIIFDESIGDVIKAQGKGNLNLQINTLGNFNMFGQYELTEGEYLFTLQNILNKKFKLSTGSKMMWDGDPYEARLDIQAIYNTRASLQSLMPEDSTGRYRRRVPVELILNLGGYLLNPDIAFDINIPQADEMVQSRLESILYVNQNNVNEQELNQQVFGLLLLGQFMPPSTGESSGTASRGAPGMNNGYELLSNQLSNWLSSMSDDFDVGVSYRPADNVSQEEVDVSLTTEILDDRLVLDGTFGYSADRQIASDGNASNFIGEFMVEYKLKKDGKLRIRGFNRSNNYDPLQINSLYTQGVGIFYQEEYDHFSEVWRRYFHKSKARKEDEEL